MSVPLSQRLLAAAAIIGFFHLAEATELTEAEQVVLRSAKPGDIVQLEELLVGRHDLPLVPVQIQPDGGPQFLFSDKPEYLLSGDGITLRETVRPGRIRLYLYHVPTPGDEPKTISAVIENLGTKPLKLRIHRRALPPPGTDYHLIGKTGLLDFFNSRPERKLAKIAPGARAVLDPQLDASVATRNQLIHGFYEFEINQPAQVTVFQRRATEKSLEVLDTLPLLPQTLPEKTTGNGAGRGLFHISDFIVTNTPGSVFDTTHGPQQLLLATGKNEGWIQGHDSIDGQPSRNVGNYGVLYRIRLTCTNSDGHGIALLMCKISSTSRWCTAQAGAVTVSKGHSPAGVIPLPRERVSFGQPGEAVLIQKFPPLRKGKTQTIEIIYSPPGASCTPTPLVLAPYRE